MSSPSESRVSVDPALFVASLWLRVGFIGASAAAAGLFDVMEAESSSLTALALIFSGTVLAVFGWHRGLRVLEPAERMNELRGNADIVVSPDMIERRGQS